MNYNVEKRRSNAIPVIKNNGFFLKLESEENIDCFYGFISKTEKEKHIELIGIEMNDYSDFNIHYDFRVFTRCNQREWGLENNVMVYENKDVTNEDRLISDGTGNYECILWISARKKR